MDNLLNFSQALILNDYKAALALQSEEVLPNSNNERGAVIVCVTAVSVQIADEKNLIVKCWVTVLCKTLIRICFFF